ncbi:MAG: BlaI/MecI/CopY family transcriptional regulator [Oscillospiraceae bacterium]|nr:BlaI/MecI/CopY family transcriptional regulator [Oscillospiraceae bacterium]
MNKKVKKLPETELEIMLCLWDAGESVQRSYFNTKFADKGWSDSTILTMLSRLTEKGFITFTKNGNKNVYSPAISREEYMQVENASFLGRLHKGSIKHFVASLAEADSLSSDDIDELENLLKQLREK